MTTIQAGAELNSSAEQKAKANAEMAKSSGQATNTAAPPAEKQHGQPGDSKSTFEKLKEDTKSQKPGAR
ncbi:MAG: hypothetical protein Q9176_004654 [Flavoplaca citrina]